LGMVISFKMKTLREIYNLLNTEITSEIALKIIALLDRDLSNEAFNKIYELVVAYTHFKYETLLDEAREVIKSDLICNNDKTLLQRFYIHC